jgi:hypothetical protein
MNSKSQFPLTKIDRVEHKFMEFPKCRYRLMDLRNNRYVLHSWNLAYITEHMAYLSLEFHTAMLVSCSCARKVTVLHQIARDHQLGTRKFIDYSDRISISDFQNLCPIASCTQEVPKYKPFCPQAKEASKKHDVMNTTTVQRSHVQATRIRTSTTTGVAARVLRILQ